MPDEARDIDCLTALRRLWEFLDEELTDERMEEVRHHLAICEDCLPHHDFACRFLAALRHVRESQTAPVTLRTRLMVRLSEVGFVRNRE